ncbi:hypothetical protein GJ744_006483 [Endocarpon pusillum]|uniref:Uncharacterized protein n=1 Tax=Endocarpon pusillum TaxID=364733 RepID=A0A8H7AT36_9EURO|nr:hypothetical protein GJ744_006483 [Endocarpon pusillum]
MGDEKESGSSTTSQRISPHTKHAAVVDGWAKELLSWLFGALCLGAIAVILRTSEGRPVPQLRFGLTLNAIVALFSTLVKVALMSPVTECISQLKWTSFAKAERNLYDFHQFDLASRGEWGSLLFLLRGKKSSLPCLGAVITVAAFAASTLTQQAVIYSPRLTPSENATLPVTQLYSPRQSPAYESSFRAGYYGGVNIRNAINIGLWTNSTKPIQPLEPACSTGNCTWPAYRSLGVCMNMADISHLVTEEESEPGTFIRSLPNGSFLNISNHVPSTINISNSQQEEISSNATLAFQDDPGYARIASVFVMTDYSRGRGTNTSALEFLLYFCTREYSTVVVNGRASTNETIISATNANLGANNDSYPRVEVDYILYGDFRDGNASTDIADLFATALFTHAGDLTLLLGIMQNMVTSLTNTIRVDAGDGTTIIGTAYSYELYVQVQWYWLIFLAGLVLGSGVLLLGTIFQSQQTKIAVWKSSILAVLYALDETIRKDTALESTKVLQARTKQVTAHLSRDGNRSKWALMADVDGQDMGGVE